MGLFDIFKKKDNDEGAAENVEEATPETTENGSPWPKKFSGV